MLGANALGIVLLEKLPQSSMPETVDIGYPIALSICKMIFDSCQVSFDTRKSYPFVRLTGRVESRSQFQGDSGCNITCFDQGLWRRSNASPACRCCGRRRQDAVPPRAP